MKNYLLAIAFSLLATSLLAQSKETRNVEDFSFVSVGISSDVIIKQGNKVGVILEGDKETLEKIETTVTGNKLRINNKDRSWFSSSKKIRVYITLKDFTGLGVSGSSKVRSDGSLQGDDVRLSVSGSGDIDLDLMANDIDCSISGSGSINLSGEGKTGELSISGSGKLDAANFALETMGIKISGSGDAYIFASKEINSRISGSGTIHYKGSPDKIENHSSGSGKLRKM